MENPELSNGFDILYNNITSNQAPGLNEFEKSWFLTQALELVLRGYFNPKGNKFQEGFDDSLKRLVDFSALVVTSKPTVTINIANVDPRRIGVGVVSLPKDILFTLNERLTVARKGSTTYLLVIPIDYLEYTRLMSQPYKRPLHYQAWRLQSMNVDSQIDLIAGNNDTILEYEIRYVKRPRPIILTDLEEVTIYGISQETSCELDPSLHMEILERAVELAKAAYTGNLESSLVVGQLSGTNLGMVTQSK